MMSVSGGLMGAVAGVMLALLTHTLFGLAANTIYLMAVSVLVGGLLGAMFSVVMLVRREAAPVAQPSRVPLPAPVESN
jgi:NhaP-type Na+/H+ or K+/H+ antiporter